MRKAFYMYTGVLAAVAVALGALALNQVAAERRWTPLVVFTVASTVAQFLTYRSFGYKQNLGGAVNLLALLLGGTPVAIVAAGASTFFQGMITRSDRRDWARLTFNTSQFTIAAAFAGLLLQAAGGKTGYEFRDPLAGLLAALGYLGCNNVLTAGAMVPLRGEPFLRCLLFRFDPAFTLTYVLSQVLAVLSGFLLANDWRWIVMVAIFVAFLQLTFERYYQLIEQAQTRSKELVAVLDATQSVIALVAASGVVRMANRDFEHLCGLPAGGAQGRRLQDVMPPDLAGLLDSAVSGEPVTMVLGEAAGDRRHLVWHRAPVRDEDGKLLGTVEVFTDISALQETQARLTEMYEAMIRTLTAAIDARDQYTRGHSERVSRYSTQLAEHLGLERKDISRIQYSALLHDIGKVGVDDAVLRKAGPLTPDERAMMMLHPVIGSEVLQQAPVLHDLVPGVRWHHEWLNGGGYPDGLSAGHIPLDARIIGVADAFDAMTTQRPYRKALSPAEALQRLQAGRSEQFDPAVVDALTTLYTAGAITITEWVETRRHAAAEEGLGTIRPVHGKELQLLAQLSRLDLTREDLPAVLNRFLQLLQGVTRPHTYSVLLQEDAQMQTVARVGHQDPGPVPAHLAEVAAAAGAPLAGAGSKVAHFPLQINGEVLGLLLLEAVGADGFSADELYLAEVLAHQVAGAVSLARYHRRLTDAATRDSLTGLYNRGHFFERLEEEVRGAAAAGHRLTLAMLDVNGFKELNDRFGHTAGDRALQEWARWLRERLPRGALAARYGGDEFVVVLPGLDRDAAEAVVAAVARPLAHFSVQERVLPLPDLAYGMAAFPADAATPARLIAAADEAMYRQKRAVRLPTPAPG